MADKESKKEDAAPEVVPPVSEVASSKPDVIDVPGAIADPEQRELMERVQREIEERKAREASMTEEEKHAERYGTTVNNGPTAENPFGMLAPSAPVKKTKPLYDEMVDVLSRGMSVQWQGRVITHISQIPSEVELARGDIEAQYRARTHLYEEKARLERQIAGLEAEIEAIEELQKTAGKGKK